MPKTARSDASAVPVLGVTPARLQGLSARPHHKCDPERSWRLVEWMGPRCTGGARALGLTVRSTWRRIGRSSSAHTRRERQPGVDVGAAFARRPPRRDRSGGTCSVTSAPHTSPRCAASTRWRSTRVNPRSRVSRGVRCAGRRAATTTAAAAPRPRRRRGAPHRTRRRAAVDATEGARSGWSPPTGARAPPVSVSTPARVQGAPSSPRRASAARSTWPRGRTAQAPGPRHVTAAACQKAPSPASAQPPSRSRVSVTRAPSPQ